MTRAARIRFMNVDLANRGGWVGDVMELSQSERSPSSAGAIPALANVDHSHLIRIPYRLSWGKEEDHMGTAVRINGPRRQHSPGEKP